MNTYLIIILALIVFNYVLDLVLNRLNLSHISSDIPDEFQGVYDADKYDESQRYLKDTTRFDQVSSTIQTPIQIAFIVLGGFALVDGWAQAAGFGLIGTGLVFAGILALLSQVLSLPFSIYSTFVLEEKYGFNKTTPKTFIMDLIKGLLLMAIIGGLVFSFILWFFDSAGNRAWWYSWAALTVFQLVLMYVAPQWIMPLFNKFTPLEDGDLKSAIEEYAEKEEFSLQGIFKMDGSKRSTKSNAYFTGFGKMRRIVLFDTLIEKHSVAELVSVLAHEVGHYKLKHITKMVVTSILSTGLMFYILNLFISKPGLYEAFGLTGEPSTMIYAGFIFFGFLYSPISLILGIFGNILSRKHEFEADAYAVNTANEPESMIAALKTLSVDNLSNLTPHPLLVFMEYSHPPVLERIKAIRKLAGSSPAPAEVTS